MLKKIGSLLLVMKRRRRSSRLLLREKAPNKRVRSVARRISPNSLKLKTLSNSLRAFLVMIVGLPLGMRSKKKMLRSQMLL